ncbi:PIN domain-containing protein [Thermodesulfobacteriota bacterium]
MSEGKTLLPDTNVILRYLLQDDGNQYKKAFGLFEEIRQGNRNAVILESVLVECVYVLLKFYSVPRNDICTQLQGILHYKGIVNQDRDALVEALKIFAETKFDIVDTILFTKAKHYDMEAFSFDRDLQKLSKK